MVAAVVDEVAELAVGDGPGRQLEVLEPDPVPGRLVVVAEAPAVGADLGDTPGEPGPCERARSAVRRRRRAVPVGGLERILGQHVLDVRQHQLLVLLLVVQPERDQEPDRLVGVGQQARDGVIHVASVGEGLFDRRP